MKPKAVKTIYWVTTILISLVAGLIPALTFQTEAAKGSIKHLGYPEYFGILLLVFEVCGVLVLVIPVIPARIKEWAYACFAVNFLCALISLWTVDGFGPTLFFPAIALLILVASYDAYHKMSSGYSQQ